MKKLTPIDLETLHDVVEGLSDAAIAKRRFVSISGVQRRIGQLLIKFELYRGDDYNPRARLIFLALSQGIIKASDLV